MTFLRPCLNFLYRFSGGCAAACLVMILVLIVVQMLARWTGEVFPGAPDYAGYAMAAASFLAFSYALNRGAHIRVSLLLNILPPRWRFILDLWCLGLATVIGWYVAFYAWRFTFWSWKFGDISQGQDATALWIPQSFMLLGAIILAIALTDNLLTLLVTGKHRIAAGHIERSGAAEKP
ncbi:MAG: TRAP transporter small permease [Pseudomonadota bacterium]